MGSNTSKNKKEKSKEGSETESTVVNNDTATATTTTTEDNSTGTPPLEPEPDETTVFESRVEDKGKEPREDTATTSTSTVITKETLKQYSENLHNEQEDSLAKIETKVSKMDDNTNPEKLIIQIMTKQITVLRNLRTLTDNIKIWTSLYILEHELNKASSRLGLALKPIAPPLTVWNIVINSQITIQMHRIFHRLFLENLGHVQDLLKILYKVLKEEKPNLRLFKSFEELLEKVYDIVFDLEHDPITLIGYDSSYNEVMGYFEAGINYENNSLFRKAIQIYIAYQQNHQLNEDEYWQTHTLQKKDVLKAQLSHSFNNARDAPNFFQRAQETGIVKHVVKPLNENLSQTSSITTRTTSGLALLGTVITTTIAIIEIIDPKEANNPVVNRIKWVAFISAVVVFILFIIINVLTCMGCKCCQERPDDEEPDEHTPLNRGYIV
jgi:hypothetical protein